VHAASVRAPPRPDKIGIVDIQFNWILYQHRFLSPGF
jgi:hypothetical protein